MFLDSFLGKKINLLAQSNIRRLENNDEIYEFATTTKESGREGNQLLGNLPLGEHCFLLRAAHDLVRSFFQNKRELHLTLKGNRGEKFLASPSKN